MALSAVLKAVMDRLATNEGAPVPWDFGEEFIAKHSDAPRVVWVPRTGTGKAPEKSSDTMRSLRTRALSVEAHCWGNKATPEEIAAHGSHWDRAEALLNAVTVALHAVAGGSYDLNGEEWASTGAELMAKGRVIIARFEIRVPVTVPRTTTATVSHVEAQVALLNPVLVQIDRFFTVRINAP
jgi:hypothetical protein